MVQEVILHVGMPKTGSSSIQGSLDGYDDGTIRYAHFDESNHSGAIGTIFSENPGQLPEHKNFGRTEKEIAALKAKYTAQLARGLQAPVQKLIISGEGIAQMPETAKIALHDQLSRSAQKISVVAYVRPAVGYASSAFQQRIKTQNERVDDLTDPVAIPLPEYRRRFDDLIRIFGRDNVTFTKFSKNVIQGSVVDHFCGLVGIPEGAVTDRQVNESLPFEAVGLLYDFNRNGPVSRGAPNLIAARRRLIRTLSRLFDTRFRLPVGLITAHLDSADITWMEQVAGFDLGPTRREMATTTDTTLEDYVTPISAGTVRTLKAHLREKRIRFLPDDKALHLVTRLYYFFLIKGGRKTK